MDRLLHGDIIRLRLINRLETIGWVTALGIYVRFKDCTNLLETRVYNGFTREALRMLAAPSTDERGGDSDCWQEGRRQEVWGISNGQCPFDSRINGDLTAQLKEEYQSYNVPLKDRGNTREYRIADPQRKSPLSGTMFHLLEATPASAASPNSRKPGGMIWFKPLKGTM